MDLQIYTKTYIGTGVYGESSPTMLTFPFQPSILFMPVYMTTDNRGWDIIQTAMLLKSYTTIYSTFLQTNFTIKRSVDKKTFSFFGDNANHQFNRFGITYYFAAIGGYDIGGIDELAITKSSTWVVPKTGRYYMELYGA